MFEHSIQVLSDNYCEITDKCVEARKKRDMEDFKKWRAIIKEYESALNRLDPTIETDSEVCDSYPHTIQYLKICISNVSNILIKEIQKDNEEEINKWSSTIIDFKSAIAKLEKDNRQ